MTKAIGIILITLAALCSQAVAQDDFTAKQEKLLAQARADWAADPKSAEAAIWVGRRLGYLGRYGEALNAYAQGWSRHQSDPRFPRHIGHRLISLRRYDEAVNVLEEAAALAAARANRIEPDGLPNPAGVPTSTTKGNIYYHLGLAYYLQGEFSKAANAFSGAMALAANNDAAVAARYWLYLSLWRTGDQQGAARALAPIRPDWEVYESQSYLNLGVCLSGQSDCEGLIDVDLAGGSTAEIAPLAGQIYGVAMARYIKGNRKGAQSLLETLVASDAYPAFAYLAAEADLNSNFFDKD